MTFRIDLHVHSRSSGDNDSDPEEAIISAIGRNLQGIAFTEHYYYEASEEVEKFREKYGDSILIFRGVEFSSADGHCLVFGVNTDRMALKYAPATELIKVVNENGGVVIPSHPFRGGNSVGEALHGLKGICALEGYNGCNLHSFNVRAIETARRMKLPFTGGSDAHAPAEVGSCFTAFNDEVTYENFIPQLKAGNYEGVDVRKISRTCIF